MGRFFLLTDSLSDQKWKMTGESKKIGKYTCYKATYEKEVEESTFSFGNWEQNLNNQKKKIEKSKRSCLVYTRNSNRYRTILVWWPSWFNS